jgi:hypothetical protein
MKIELVRSSRRRGWPLWALFLVSLWMGMGATIIWLTARSGSSIHTCPFKLQTGIACPTCGFTRGALCLLHGRIGQAWLYNPLLFSVLAVLFTAIVVRLVFARAVRVYLTHTERAIAWVLAIALFCINWAYVILCVG